VVVDREGLTVTDHGPGIPDELLDTLFDRFLNRPGSPGHGLGLPLARWSARAHDGDLLATNRRDHGGRVTGARFTLQLPTRTPPQSGS
jgi:two-component system sensor histidine kinase MtrB